MNNTKLTMQQMGRMSVEDFHSSEKTPIAIILDNIRSMNNIGSVFRTADAFRLKGILLCGITATPPHREINKTALGATESVYWEYFPDTIEAVNFLKSKDYGVYALEQTQNSMMLQDIKVKLNIKPKEYRNIAIILGNEVEGVQQNVIDVCDGVIEIPQYGTKHSLNVSVSCGITIWEIFKAMMF